MAVRPAHLASTEGSNELRTALNCIRLCRTCTTPRRVQRARYGHADTQKDGPPLGAVRDIEQDEQDHLWLAVGGSGGCRFGGQGSVFFTKRMA